MARLTWFPFLLRYCMVYICVCTVYVCARSTLSTVQCSFYRKTKKRKWTANKFVNREKWEQNFFLFYKFFIIFIIIQMKMVRLTSLWTKKIKKDITNFCFIFAFFSNAAITANCEFIFSRDSFGSKLTTEYWKHHEKKDFIFIWSSEKCKTKVQRQKNRFILHPIYYNYN